MSEANERLRQQLQALSARKPVPPGRDDAGETGSTDDDAGRIHAEKLLRMGRPDVSEETKSGDPTQGLPRPFTASDRSTSGTTKKTADEIFNQRLMDQRYGRTTGKRTR